MRILAIETATPVGSVAIVDPAGVVAEATVRAPMHHLEWLLPAAQELLAHLRVPPGAIQGLAVSCGPGGFTGLRIGIATAAAWAQARGLPVLGIGTLEALARVPGAEGLVLPALDAHRGEVAWALYRLGPGNGMECVVAPAVTSPGALVAEMASHPGPLLLLGDALVRYGDPILAALGARARAGGPHLHPRAATVGLLALPRLARGERTDPEALRPIYGRRAVVWQGQETPRRGGNQT